MALSLYRKYRPEVFADVVGQEHVEKTLINAISEGAVAHAYLFCGPRGTGKTTSARLLAKALLCESAQNGQPDGTCPQCLEIAQGTHPDVFELDAASRTGVDNVREEIIGRVGFAPTRGRFKVYIIDEVHMLSTAAFNALLKTLEEPPEHVVFVLCTTDPHKVPETIQSRCQRFDFRRFSVEEIVGYLERISKGEGFEYEPEALEFIAAKSAGGMRDATTALEQVGVYTEGKITLDEATRMFGQIDIAALFEITGYIARRDTPSCFVWVNDLVGRGVDLSQFARDLAAHLRNLYVTAITGGENGIVACTAAQLERYRQQATEFGGVDRLARALDICGALVAELRNSSDARLSVEIAMTRLTRPDSELTLEALAERIEALELRPSMAAAPVISNAAEKSQLEPVADSGMGDFSTPSPYGDSGRNDSPVSDDLPPWEGSEPSPVAMDETAPSTIPADTSPSVISSEASDSERSREISPAADMSPERLLAALLSVVKREDAATGALLSGVSLSTEDGQYQLLFPTGSDFQMRIVNGPDAKAIINKAFAEVLGHEVHFSCQIGSFSGLSAQPAPLTSEPPVSIADDVPPIDDGYFESLVAEQQATPVDEMPADFADALSAFGAGVKVQEINDEE
ncbi:MAG: DNA polymerase III subunit gamma/tau [Coriobacteriia bacterium]|nr:MAG: DNA polymerase III subunit gamma/tau [Coriobacteriia bacterium]